MMPLEPRVNFGILADRLQRLVRLDTTVFDDVRQDPSATVPSIMVVVASTLLAAIGGWLWWNIQDFPTGGGVLLDSLVLGTVFSVALWIVWLLVAWVILGQLFHEQAELQELLRTMGMAAAPLALSIGIFIPGISFGLGLAARISDGAAATMRREQVDDGVWMLTSVTLTGSGRALLFLRGFSIDYSVLWFDYRPAAEVSIPGTP